MTVAAARPEPGYASTVTVAREGAVATVLVDNPPVNAMSEAVLAALHGTLSSLGDDDAVRAIVVGSTGVRTFMAGADVDELRSMASDQSLVRRHVELSARLFEGISRIPQPVIAAADGSAVGGGFEVLLACDFAVIAESAQVGFPELGLGLIPGAGGTQRLTRRVGVNRALRMIIARELIPATEAVALGLASEAASDGETLGAAQALAARISDLPATAVRAAKRVIRNGAECPLSEGLRLERDEFVSLFATEDAREGIEAFLAKRDPEFRHR